MSSDVSASTVTRRGSMARHGPKAGEIRKITAEQQPAVDISTDKITDVSLERPDDVWRRISVDQSHRRKSIIRCNAFLFGYRNIKKYDLLWWYICCSTLVLLF